MMSMKTMNPAEPLRVGVLPLARPTFDVPYAEQVCEEAWKLMEQIPIDWVGSSDLLFDAKSVESQLSGNDQNSRGTSKVSASFTVIDASVKVNCSTNSKSRGSFLNSES